MRVGCEVLGAPGKRFRACGAVYGVVPSSSCAVCSAALLQVGREVYMLPECAIRQAPCFDIVTMPPRLHVFYKTYALQNTRVYNSPWL